MRLAGMAAVWLMAVPLAATAQDPVGVVKTVRGGVQVERAGATLPASVGLGIHAADRVTTAADGAVGMSFQDDSVLSLGPGSTLAISSFRFDPTTHDGAFESELRRGTLSAVSGKIAKQTPEAMRIRTPTTTLGVRGTEFFVQVLDADR